MPISSNSQYALRPLSYFLLAFVVAKTPSVEAQTADRWLNTGTDFNTAANWSLGTVPTSSNKATFSGTPTNQPILSASLTVGALSLVGGWDLTGIAGSTLTLNTSASSTFSGSTVDVPLILRTNQSWVLEGGTSTFNGVISSANNVSLNLGAGGGSVALNGANTYTGTTLWTASSAMTIFLGNDSAFGASTVNIDAALLTFSATTDLTGANRIANAITVSTNKITFANNQGYNLEFGGAVSLGGSLRTFVGSAGTTTFSGVISGSSGLSYNTNGGSFVASGANTYAAATSVYGTGGSLSVSSIGNSGSAGNLGEAATISLGSTTSSGALVYTGSGESTNRTIVLAGTTGGGELDSSGSGALTVAGFSATGAGAKTFTLGGTNTGANTFAGNVVDNSTSNQTALTKTGTGTWTLTGANTYTGATTITAGTLSLGAANTLTGATGGVTINNGGTLALSTSTTLGGGLTLNGGGTLNLGANQLTLGTGSALALSGGAIDITLGTASGQIMGSGSLTLAGGTLVLNTAGAGFNYDTSYQVISGLGANNLSSLSITGYDSSDYTAHLDDTGDLSFTANNLSAVPEPSTYALIAGVAALGFACVRRRWAA